MTTKSYNGLEREEIVSRLKAIVTERGYVKFTLPDNCPGDGWDGTLCLDGLYAFGNNHFVGEFFRYSDEQPIDTDLLQEILDIVDDILVDGSKIKKIDSFITLKIKSNN